MEPNWLGYIFIDGFAYTPDLGVYVYFFDF